MTALGIGLLVWMGLTVLVWGLCSSAARGDRAQAAVRLQERSGIAAEARTRLVERRLLHELGRHDGFTGRHSERVARLAGSVGRRLGLPPDALRALVRAAALHDVGKLRVPDVILGKPGRLDAAEWAIIARHPDWGAAMLCELLERGEGLDAVRSHHERFDGGGYPDGLAGSAIPLMGRIVGACDAYDAMTSTRPYQPSRTRAAALAELARCSGTQFDPAVVAALEAAVRAGADLAPGPAARSRSRFRRSGARRGALLRAYY
ncbi:MAG: HD domain-containing protein [Actinomycetota bacterium]|nr:HD domain-containing protein [Actinomycetota bacterium]